MRVVEGDLQRLGHYSIPNEMELNIHMFCLRVKNWVDREIVGPYVVIPQSWGL